ALAEVDGAWPAAGAEIRRRTWLVVPLVEAGTVSYSLIARPGISYINVLRGTILDPADDLLHETAHHRLHGWQELGELIRDGAHAPHYDSPWRRAPRPLNGILHGTYTFLFRAELFLRMLRHGALPVAKREWLRREALRELRNCRKSLGDLREAAAAGWLTRRGRSLLGSLGRRLDGLRGGGLSGAGPFSIF